MSEKRVAQHQFQLTRAPMLQNDDSKVIGYEYMIVSPDETIVIHNSAIDSDPLDLKKHDSIASNTYNFLLEDYAYKGKLKGYDVNIKKSSVTDDPPQ